ncbi:hypothetical protein BDP55DRAFT_677390 [Colletotrichum godetiae]|uniref:Uncharacterized protein n=1 Tax=Colletotrichum godetiae TaxID=1209918 RepID=A0AAJ0ET35_9PEZI|nr:uncharacterized protein BDP55DRAFT_677390 [Colletotrichum godetiae]KAK1660124.1 hypothetical protein BDP55DRAFT_677390 [Colletotrichum godetiae]
MTIRTGVCLPVGGFSQPFRPLTRVMRVYSRRSSTTLSPRLFGFQSDLSDLGAPGNGGSTSRSRPFSDHFPHICTDCGLASGCTYSTLYTLFLFFSCPRIVVSSSVFMFALRYLGIDAGNVTLQSCGFRSPGRIPVVRSTYSVMSRRRVTQHSSPSIRAPVVESRHLLQVIPTPLMSSHRGLKSTMPSMTPNQVPRNEATSKKNG